MLTYGDGLCNVNLNKLKQFHLKKPIGTVTAVNPPVRFGELSISKNKISEFKEKSTTKLTGLVVDILYLIKVF